MTKLPEVHGTVTLGARGQVVIPKSARNILKVKPGEKLMVISGDPKGKDIVSLIPVRHLSKILRHFEEHISVLKTEISKVKK